MTKSQDAKLQNNLKSSTKRRPKKDFLSLAISVAVWGGTIITVGVLLFIIAYILIRGVPHLSLDFFAWEYNTENVSVLPSIITTVQMVFLALLFAAPLGIGCAIYLVEYAKSNSKFIACIRVTTETLSGIPSIVYGLFGLLFFVTTLEWGYSLLAGSFTVAIMILPLIIRSTEEALKSVSAAYREASFGLGAGKLRTIVKIVLPSAVPGILAGVILAIGRVIGETAALIFTAGTVAQVPTNLLDSGRTLAVHMYSLSSEGLYTNQAYATAVVLLITVFIINTAAAFLAKKIAK